LKAGPSVTYLEIGLFARKGKAMNPHRPRTVLRSALAGLALLAPPLAVSAPAAAKTCSTADTGIVLPKGFCATIFADKVGHARQMVVAPDGTLYVNTWSGAYYGNEKPPAGGFLLALKDSKGTGRADVKKRFGATPAEGGHGGTGIALYKDGLYAEINDRIVRYPLKAGETVPSGRAETVLHGMPLDGDHPMHPFIIDADGNLLVSMGSATNACEVKNRMPHSVGNDPCTELETRAGIWRYDASKTGQVFSGKERYASGLRNSEGLDFDAAGRLYVTQHGRDQLHENWPELYKAEQGFELPAEEVVILKQGASYGWPMCYYDGLQKKLVLAPEYGGDGGGKIGICATMVPPVAAFPAHWAPNDLKIYKGSGFPTAYQGGAFIAFHGSWNRAPGPQGGYNVVFQPLKDGATAGASVVFADGFAGRHKEPDRAAHRPSGLAVAPDGALFISDDKAGRIWRVTYEGDPGAPVEAAPGTVGKTAAASPEAAPPEGTNPEATSLSALPVPPGASRDQLALGQKIFHGEAAGATCAGCHGADGTGSSVGADLTSGKWLWSDGSLKGIAESIRNGVPRPKQHTGAMPPYGGIELKDSDLEAVAAYVWALGHRKKG
jgi:glucose/arabinose dehydrogenase/mono/diheme cytochrome c family protein